MPCYQAPPTTEEMNAHGEMVSGQLEAVLCGMFTAIEGHDVEVSDCLDDIDWEQVGVSRDLVKSWWAKCFSATATRARQMKDNTEGTMQMSEALRIIKDACEDLKSNGFHHSPRIVAQSEFDLSGFEEQESGIPGLQVEYVDQRGPGMTGDDFEGTMAWPIGGGWLFVCGFCT